MSGQVRIDCGHFQTDIRLRQGISRVVSTPNRYTRNGPVVRLLSAVTDYRRNPSRKIRDPPDCPFGFNQQTGPMDRILHVEDSEPFRQLVFSIFQENSDSHFIEQAADGLEGVQKAENLKPDLVLLDIGLPKLNGIDVAKLIRKRSSNSRIVFLTQETDLDVVKAALDTGALGYVHKQRAGIELRTAVEAALRGRKFVSRNLSPAFRHVAAEENRENPRKALDR